MPLIRYGEFTSHSRVSLPWKIDCDALTELDFLALAEIVRQTMSYSEAIGIPRGGLRFAAALRPHCRPGYPALIVDDVLTTGRSMEEARRIHWSVFPHAPVCGVVIFARGPVPDWVWPIFTVAEWTQCRATGLG
jgi:hypoxanthine phosphoribosyltransferase